MVQLTKRSLRKKLCIYIHYLLNKKSVTKFGGIKNPNKVDGEGILNSIVEVLKSLKSPESMSVN